MNNSEDLALSFLTFSNQYLILVGNVARETALHGNKWMVLSDFDIKSEVYYEETRWSDFSIIFPLLFNLFHGIELLIKGLILVDPSEKMKRGHDLFALYDRFKSKYPEQIILNNFFKRYTNKESMPGILQKFMFENKLDANMLYEELRYPSPDFDLIHKYASLKYQDKEGVPFFKDLADEIDSVLKTSVKLYYSLKREV